ncbi:MAG: hypothetical protein M1401_18090 [Chloroflexi bacterium]|nr:hypothetical protein [Chloroflexota bacterium]
MIVRIASEGQYRLDDSHLARLNELDNRLVVAVQKSDAQSFESLFKQLVGLVRENGQRLADEEILPSDLYLPAPDTTLAEASAIFAGEGMIPG